MGPQGEGDRRQLFTICAGGDQTVCQVLGSQAGLGIHAGGSPWGWVTCSGLLASPKPLRLMDSSEKRLSRHEITIVTEVCLPCPALVICCLRSFFSFSLVCLVLLNIVSQRTETTSSLSPGSVLNAEGSARHSKFSPVVTHGQRDAC